MSETLPVSATLSRFQLPGRKGFRLTLQYDSLT